MKRKTKLLHVGKFELENWKIESSAARRGVISDTLTMTIRIDRGPGAKLIRQMSTLDVFHLAFEEEQVGRRVSGIAPSSTHFWRCMTAEPMPQRDFGKMEYEVQLIAYAY